MYKVADLMLRGILCLRPLATDSLEEKNVSLYIGVLSVFYPRFGCSGSDLRRWSSCSGPQPKYSINYRGEALKSRNPSSTSTYYALPPHEKASNCY